MSDAGPWGRVTPRASARSGESGTASTSTLPAPGSWVGTGPPLSATGPSATPEASVLTPGPVSPQVASPTTVYDDGPAVTVPVHVRWPAPGTTTEPTASSMPACSVPASGGVVPVRG